MTYGAGFNLMTEKSVEDGGFQATISSNAITLNDMLELDVGAPTWTDADASTQYWQLKAIAMETVTTAATVINVQLCYPGQLWAAETANNSAAADNGDRMILTDANTVNNTGTDSAAQEAVFTQLFIIGAVAEKRIGGLIAWGGGINPDAA